jgi:hypothetical protein
VLVKPADVNPASCPAGTPGHTDSASGCGQQSAPAGAVGTSGDPVENLHTAWETAWIDLGGEG